MQVEGERKALEAERAKVRSPSSEINILVFLVDKTVRVRLTPAGVELLAEDLLLGDVRRVLYELKTETEWEGVVVAVASCTDEPACDKT